MDPRQPQRPAQLSKVQVARIGGGGSARIGALVVVAVLGAVVWVGLSNRAPSGPRQPRAPAIAGGTATPAPTERPTPAPTEPPSTYAVSATIGNREYLAALEELLPGRMFATLRVPMPPEEASGILTIAEFGLDPRSNPVTVGDWTMPLDSLFSVSRDPELVIVAGMPARLDRADVPLMMRGGFGLKVYAENDLLFGILSVELTLKVLDGPLTRDLPR